MRNKTAPIPGQPSTLFLRHHASMHQRVSQWQKFHANSVPGIRERPALDIAFGRPHASMNQHVSQRMHFHINSAPGIREMLPNKQRNVFSYVMRNKTEPIPGQPWTLLLGAVILQCTNVCRDEGISILTLYPAFGRCHLTSKELVPHKHYVTKVNNF